MGEFSDLIAYKKAFKLAMEIFELSKEFPFEEKLGLTSQIRRSSRSVCANITESYSRRAYIKYFKAKLFDASCENAETRVWLDFALSCNYISKDKFSLLADENRQIGLILKYMIKNPEKFLELPGTP